MCQVAVITNKYQVHDHGGEDQATKPIFCIVYIYMQVFQNSLLSSILRKTYVTQRALQEESAVLRENVLSLIYLHSKLNSYGGNIARKLWSSCVSSYSVCVTWCVIRTLGRSVLEPIAKPSHTEASVLYKVLGTVRVIF